MLISVLLLYENLSRSGRMCLANTTVITIIVVIFIVYPIVFSENDTFKKYHQALMGGAAALMFKFIELYIKRLFRNRRRYLRRYIPQNNLNLVVSTTYCQWQFFRKPQRKFVTFQQISIWPDVNLMCTFWKVCLQFHDQRHQSQL